MSQYYNSKRARNVYNSDSVEPFKLSRSKIELFIECPRCFYLDRRLGVGRPPGFPFSLNSAVDALLKKEFDIHRAKGTPHPLMIKYGIKAVPFSHKDMDKWRENFVGVQYLHEPTNFIITGVVDDVWLNDKGELIVVDYKSTSKNEKITELNKEWQDGYKRQMEIYQWLLRQNGHKVSDQGYFVYCNGQTDKEAFDGKLEFEVTLVPYKGDDSWVEKAIANAKKCLDGDLPEQDPDCDYCNYVHAVAKEEKELSEPK
ncbi:MAG: PD-(D/E)XK nuclease family protein [Patescibacteria group bacterium]|nr:PD-(D/E)XK nuclease family protein [Patescibacteria group bacterium]